MAGSWIKQHQSMDHITIGQSPRQCRSTGKDHTKLPGPDKWPCHSPTVLDAWIFPKQSHFLLLVFHTVKRNSFFSFFFFFFFFYFFSLVFFFYLILIYFSFIPRILMHLDVSSSIYIGACLFHLARWLVVYRMPLHLAHFFHLEMIHIDPSRLEVMDCSLSNLSFFFRLFDELWNEITGALHCLHLIVNAFRKWSNSFRSFYGLRYALLFLNSISCSMIALFFYFYCSDFMEIILF